MSLKVAACELVIITTNNKSIKYIFFITAVFTSNLIAFVADL
jgi:hypothetical protein